MGNGFTKATKRAALQRSGKKCEAIGKLYGLIPDARCEAPLGYGFEFDHVLATSNGGDDSLENCAVVCRPCHAFKTAKHDTPRAAKTVRQRDKHNGIKPRYSRPVPGSKASGLRKRLSGKVERR
jgi:5-methylcytosine-specific restriction enzyme A